MDIIKIEYRGTFDELSCFDIHTQMGVWPLELNLSYRSLGVAEEIFQRGVQDLFNKKGFYWGNVFETIGLFREIWPLL